MALQTLIQYTESNLVGTLTAGLTTTATTITARMYDRVSGLARVPDANTLIFVIDKGAPNQPSSSYEIIKATSHSTSAGVTTFTGCARGLSFSGVSLAAGTGKLHVAGAEIGTVDLHIDNNALVATVKGVGDQPIAKVYASASTRDADVPSPTEGMYCFLQDKDRLVYYDGTRWIPAATTMVFADATARDAYYASPFTGLSCYLTTEGYYTDYTGGGWVTRANGAVSNGSTTVAGIFQEATDAQVGAHTATGSTGARLTINPGSTSSTGANNKIPTGQSNTRLDKSWLWDEPYVEMTAGETLAIGDPVYVKQSDTKMYKALNTSIEAAAVMGFALNTANANDTVYVQVAGVSAAHSGLTAGAAVYLSATGTCTPTAPVLNATGTIPVSLGIATSTSEFTINIKRIPRVISVSTAASNASTITVTIGMDWSIAELYYTDFWFNSGTDHSMYIGYVDSVSSVNRTINSGVVYTDVCYLYRGTGNAGSNFTTFAGTKSSNNLLLTRVDNNITVVFTGLLVIAYENI